MTREQYVKDVKNWLMELAIGARAAMRSVQFAPEETSDTRWKVTADSYNKLEKGVGVHKIKDVAEVIGEPIKFKEFDPDDYLYGKYDGYWCLELYGVEFYDFGEAISNDGK